MLVAYTVPALVIYIWLLIAVGLLALSVAILWTIYDIARWIWLKVF